MKFNLQHLTRVYRSASILVAVIVLSLQGCYTYSTGTFLDRQLLDHSEVLQSSDYKLLIEKRPSPSDPTLTISLKRFSLYRFRTLEYHTEIKQTSKVAGTILLLLGGGAIYAMTRTDQKDTLALAGEIVGGAMGIIWGAGMIMDDKKESTGRVVKVAGSDSLVSVYEAVSNQFRIALSAIGRTQTATSDWHGAVQFHMVKDFGLERFETPQNVAFYAYSDQPKLSESIVLSTSEWTIQQIEVQAQGWVYSNPTSKANKVTRYRRGDVYQVLDSDQKDWVRVRIQSSEGWLPALAGSIFWSVK